MPSAEELFEFPARPASTECTTDPSVRSRRILPPMSPIPKDEFTAYRISLQDVSRPAKITTSYLDSSHVCPIDFEEQYWRTPALPEGQQCTLTMLWELYFHWRGVYCVSVVPTQNAFYLLNTQENFVEVGDTVQYEDVPEFLEERERFWFAEEMGRIREAILRRKATPLDSKG